MTWSIRIVDINGDGDKDKYHICYQCKHNQYCYLPKVVSPLMTLLNSIEMGCDGHNAGGNGLMKCQGFEKKDLTSS